MPPPLYRDLGQVGIADALSLTGWEIMTQPLRQALQVKPLYGQHGSSEATFAHHLAGRQALGPSLWYHEH